MRRMRGVGADEARWLVRLPQLAWLQIDKTAVLTSDRRGLSSDFFQNENCWAIAATLDASEPDIEGQFSVSLGETADTDTVISYTVTGTATPDEDYTALTGTVTIPAGDLSAPIDVVPLDDSVPEEEESVTVTLDEITAGDSDVVFGTADTATVFIADNDATTTEPTDPVSDTTDDDLPLT